MSTIINLFAVLMFVAIFLVFATIIISWLKGEQKARHPNWTFLDYFSVGYARHLYLRYILRRK